MLRLLLGMLLIAVQWPNVARAQWLASGDITERGAVLWMQVEVAGRYTLEVAEDAAFARVAARPEVTAAKEGGLMAQTTIDTLKPATRYRYRLRGASGVLPRSGMFTTAPTAQQKATLKLLFGADLGGQGYGRLRSDVGLEIDGWPIFRAMAAEKADLFVALGDMLYSDRPITAQAPDHPKGNAFQIPKPGPGYVTNVEDFRRDWHYHRSDHQYMRFLEVTPMLATWDDHELVNDGGGPELTQGPSAEELARDPQLAASDPSRPRNAGKRRQGVFHNPGLFQAGRQVMYEYNPIRVLPDPSGMFDRRLYRSFRWGAHAEIIMLDTRSYRDPRYRYDTADKPKTMLGVAQKQWLKDVLTKSTATWKIIVSSVPLATVGGNERDPQKRIYRDSWARGEADNPYGYMRELTELATFLRERGVRNVLFLSGDHHFTNLYSYDPDGDGTPDFYEANVGPLRAGPSKGRLPEKTLNPTVLFSDAGRATFTYGQLAIDGGGRLSVEMRGVDGATIAGARLQFDPR